jgi:hypothetical protein
MAHCIVSVPYVLLSTIGATLLALASSLRVALVYVSAHSGSKYSQHHMETRT